MLVKIFRLVYLKVNDWKVNGVGYKGAVVVFGGLGEDLRVILFWWVFWVFFGIYIKG